MLLLLTPALAADAWSPLRVALECQTSGRIDACTLVRGMLDAEDVIAVVPRSEAQGVLYVNVTLQANEDRVHLRLVGEVAGAPPSFEQLQPVDSRLPVDEQRGALEPAVMRTLAPYVAVIVPEAVSVQIEAPEDGRVDAKTTPWGLSLWGGSWAWWTASYQNISFWTGTSVYRVTDAAKMGFWVNYDRSIARQPELTVDDTDVSLSTDTSRVAGAIGGSRNLDGHWTVGTLVRGGHDDPEGQYLGTGRAHVGIERNWFPSDDPRGNRLAAAYAIGVQADAYNHINTLGEERAFFPTHMILVGGEVRVDTVELELELSAQAELLQPLRRYALGSEGTIDVNLGDHVDLWLRLGVTQQAIPGPAEVDASSYEELTRSSYAQPLELSGELNLRIHWDNTNGARNNRFETVGDLDPTGNL